MDYNTLRQCFEGIVEDAMKVTNNQKTKLKKKPNLQDHQKYLGINVRKDV